LYTIRTFIRYWRVIFVLLLLICPELKSQDFHLSQYEVAPLQINPANTGDFLEDLRATAGYRKQWSNLGTPFKNYSLTADAPLKIRDYNLGVGFMFLHDDLVLQQFKTTQLLASVAYETFISGYMVRIGFQGGLWTRGFDNSGITMPEQFNDITGKYDPTLPITDNPLIYDASTIDVNFGASAARYINGKKVTAGFALHHINSPKISFGDSEGRIPMLWSINASIETQPLSWLAVTPVMLARAQRTADELIVGALARTKNKWQVEQLNSLAFGMYMRSALFENFDAVMLSAGVHISDFEIFYTHDINLSSLRKATGFNGASEIGIVYKFKKQRNYIEPCIIL